MACPARHTLYILRYNDTTDTRLVGQILYSPHGKSSADEAGISAGNEDVAIHEKKTHGEHLKHSCKPNIASGMATPTLLTMHIVITIYL